MAEEEQRSGTVRIRAALLICAMQIIAFSFAPVAPGQEPYLGIPVAAEGIPDILFRHHFTYPLPDGSAYVITYSEDGTTDLVLQSGDRFEGTWTIDGAGRLCLSWPEHSRQDCFAVFLDGTVLRLVTAAGRVAFRMQPSGAVTSKASSEPELFGTSGAMAHLSP